MTIAKRIFFFLAVNILVLLTLSLILNVLNVRPYITQYGIDYQSLMIFCLVWGMGGALISLALSRVMAKWIMGVRFIDPDTCDLESKRLLNTVYELARTAHLTHMPKVGIFTSKEINAFATGPSKKRSLVAVSTGLLQKMSQKELEGVIAHEISHIANGDMVTMTLIQGVVNAFVMFLARILASVISNVGKSRNSSSSGSYGGYMILVFVFEVIFMILGSVVIAWFSRTREFRADRGGADLAGKEKMIAALESLMTVQNIKDPKADVPAFQALKISTNNKTRFGALFATHPPLQTRIARLKQL
ncbi:MAG: protease HtpX [Chlamydiota bacterium]